MEKIIEKDICEVSSQGFINYALETIKARAIPDVRDGLKPVTRRVIYAMHELNLYPDKPYKKSARIVGDAMGKYHPHGDSSIYGALVTSAQIFREQLPLIDGYGNFGSVDDSAAAMRYCVTGDTLINTNNGLIPIKDIVQNSELNSDNPINIEIQSIGNVMNRASMFFNSGKHKVIEIILKNGMSIKGSYNHPLLVVETNNKYNDYKWKTLDKITTNDIVVVNCCYQTFSRKKDIKSIDLDFLCAKLKNQPNEFYNKLKKQYDLNENEFNDFIEKYNNNDTINDSINIILQSSYVIQLEFLKKIFDLYENGFYIGETNKFISTNEELIKTIQILLLNFNQYSTIYNDSQNKNLYIIEKIEKEKHKNNYVFENIEKINYLDKEIVYSIRVDSDCHSFVGNGFINHNTESRLTPYGAYLLEGLNENAVEFVSNYDDTEKEPEVLPAFTPNLLVNGEFGIAVGYQPNIPPHNYNELIDGIIYEMDNPKATTKDLMKFVKGPDFPEGAIIDPVELELCYETGKGTIPMRAKFLVETLPLGKSQIVITEVPYLTSKEKLVSDIAKALSSEEYCFDSVTDETNKNGTRIVIAFDKGANIEKAIDTLCKKTQLQSNFSYNFIAIYNNEPITFSLKHYFDVFIETKLVVLKRIFINRLEKEKKNNERLKAIHIGAINIDEVIKIIKTSKTPKIAKERLMENLGVSEYGAQVIFEMRLSSLINTEVINVEKDIKLSDKKIKDLEKSINNEKQLKLKLKEKLIESKDLFGQPRKTKIHKFETMKMVVQEEEFVLQANGKKYKKMSASYKGDKGICIKTKSSSVINTFLNNGDFARYLGNQIKSEENYEIVGLFDDSNTQNIFFVTSEGQVKQTSFDDYKQIALDKYVLSMKLNEKEKIIACFACDDNSEVYIETKNGYAIRFFTNEVRPTGRIAGGMRGINLEKGDVVINAGLVKKGTPQASYKQQKRAGKGNKIK